MQKLVITPKKLPIVNRLYNKVTHIGKKLNCTEQKYADELIQNIREGFNPYETDSALSKKVMDNILLDFRGTMHLKHGSFMGTNIIGNVEKYVANIANGHYQKIAQNKKEFINVGQYSEKIINTAIARQEIEAEMVKAKTKAMSQGKDLSSKQRHNFQKRWNECFNKTIENIDKRNSAIEHNRTRAKELGITDSYNFVFEV